jgi:hypothetical protein
MRRRRIRALRPVKWQFFCVGDEKKECLCVWGIE